MLKNNSHQSGCTHTDGMENMGATATISASAANWDNYLDSAAPSTGGVNLNERLGYSSFNLEFFRQPSNMFKQWL